jgi:inositol polyphosphate 5-phosphatase INPP5B/F
VVAHFRFVSKLEEEHLCKPWLTMKPKFGMLLPGETAEITFTVHINTKTAQVSNHTPGCGPLT